MELPDKRLDRKLSFGCGALLGFLLSFVGVLGTGAELAEAMATAAVVAVVIGLLTIRFGSRLLEKILEWFA